MAESGWAAFKAPMASAGFACKMFDEMPCWDSDAEQEDMPSSVVWDDELVHELDTFGPAVYVEHAVPNPGQMVAMTSFCSEDAAYSAFDEVPLLDVTRDAMSTDAIVYEGFLQQLVQGTKEMEREQLPLEAPIML
jgi:hypothetical protein